MSSCTGILQSESVTHGGWRQPCIPPLGSKSPPSSFIKVASTGKSPTCLFRGGGSLGVESSSLGQRGVAGGRWAEHRTGLPMPETRWQSWEEKGSPQKQPKETGKKRRVRKGTWSWQGETRNRRLGCVEEQRCGWLGSCKPGPAWKLDPWLYKHVDGQVL